jgi:hypothetical protein
MSSRQESVLVRARLSPMQNRGGRSPPVMLNKMAIACEIAINLDTNIDQGRSLNGFSVHFICANLSSNNLAHKYHFQ